MIPNTDLLSNLRRIAAEDATTPALRALLFLTALIAALAWARRRPLVALLALSLGGLLGLGYWLAQIEAPLGYGSDPGLTYAWAQAGVNALAKPEGSSFIWGEEPRASLVSLLALQGAPLWVVAAVPQLAAVIALGLAIALPFTLMRNRTTSTLAASLTLGGGFWPGVAPYDSILLSPSSVLVVFGALVVLRVLTGGRTMKRAIRRCHPSIAVGMMIAAIFDRALSQGAQIGLTAALLLSGAGVILTRLLRVSLRKALSSPAQARRAEALLLLCVFGGSGLFWWDPPRSVAGFREARDENAALLKPMDWMRRNVPTSSVVLSSPAYSAAIAAFAGRRVLFPPSFPKGSKVEVREPFRRARLLESTKEGQPIARLAEAFSVTHLFLGPGEASPPSGTDLSLTDELRLILVLEYQDASDFRVFRLAKK